MQSKKITRFDLEMKLKHNKREKSVQEEGIRNGWKVLAKGWPDFMFYRENPEGEFEAFCVEVKKKPKRECERKHLVSPEQIEMFIVLKKLGIKVEVVQKD